MKNFVLLVVCIFVFCVPKKTQAQDDWQVGIGAAYLRFVDKSAVPNEQHLFQAPRLNATKKINKKLSINGAISFNLIKFTEIARNDVNYFSIDSFLRYSLVKNTNFTDPYVFVGVSLVTIDIRLSPAVNFGVGNTFWFLKNLGLNTQVIYKISDKNTSHFQFTGGFVYNLDSGRKALWHVKR